MCCSVLQQQHLNKFLTLCTLWPKFLDFTLTPCFWVSKTCELAWPWTTVVAVWQFLAPKHSFSSTAVSIQATWLRHEAIMPNHRPETHSDDVGVFLFLVLKCIILRKNRYKAKIIWGLCETEWIIISFSDRNMNICDTKHGLKFSAVPHITVLELELSFSIFFQEILKEEGLINVRSWIIGRGLTHVLLMQ